MSEKSFKKKKGFTLAESTPYGGMLPASAKGFTLAEVLITLGIIGIVAAMTMPSLFTHIQKVQYAAKIKKVYSMLGQVSLKAKDDGIFSYTGNSREWFKSYMAPHMKVSEYMTMSELKQRYNIQYKQLSGADETGLSAMRDDGEVVMLQDGTLLFFSGSAKGVSLTDSENGFGIYFDVNGVKLPNQFGKDAFCAVLNENEGVIPFGLKKAGTDATFGDQYDREMIKKGGAYSYGCNKNQRGMWCLGLFVADGFKFAKDYPW